jgi:hypothetical protein
MARVAMRHSQVLLHSYAPQKGNSRARSTHDKRMAEAAPSPLPTGSRLLQDRGFLAFTLD